MASARRAALPLAIATLLVGCDTPPGVAMHDAGVPDDAWRGPRTNPIAFDRARPISGGTLLVSRDRTTVYAADSDHDVVYTFSIVPGLWSVGSVALPAGSEPGRLVEDGARRVHVALRGSGGVATLSPESPLVVRDVCAAPRGLTWVEADDTIVVACAEGLLVTLPAGGGPATRVLSLDDDLRDVVVADDRLLVSRFRSAEVLALDASGVEVARWRPAVVMRPDALAAIPESSVEVEMEPHVAWRMVAAPGGAWLLHQRARRASIPAVPERPGVGTYGHGSGNCAAVLETAATFVDATAPSGTLSVAETLPIARATDMSLSPDGATMAVVGPGDDLVGGCGRSSITFWPQVLLGAPWPPSGIESLGVAGATAVAFIDDVSAVLWRRSPPTLLRYGPSGTVSYPFTSALPLPRGAELFELTTPSGLSCASCHPEGGDDGHVWTFGGAASRTQSLRGGLMSTTPFHWRGELATFAELVHVGFEERMSGPELAPAEIASLEAWLDELPAFPRPHGEPDALARGQALFESPAIGCSGCHAGVGYTTNETVDIGTGEPFQVAVLIGVAHRAPYMHDGCAATLRDVVAGETACRGTAHGATESLSDGEIDDLVTYLRSL